MSILKRFQNLNNFTDKENFYEVFFRNLHIGYIHKIVAEQFFNISLPICISNKKFYILEANGQKVNIIMQEIGEFLLYKNFITSLSGELFPCVKNLGKREYFCLDRSLVEMFGIKGYGVHLVAYVKKKKKVKLWIPKRSSLKKIAPNKFDNTVAGGVGSKENVYDALQREAYEEAGFNKSLIKQSSLSGTFNYNWRNKKYSLRRDILYLFDLEVDKQFTPYCKDGEVENFQLLDWQDVLKNIKETNNFKKNSALVIIIFLIKKGLINPYNEEEYEEINNFIS